MRAWGWCGSGRSRSTGGGGRCCGAELELRSQSLDVLDYLIRHAGRVVAKDELFAAVWPAKPASDDSLVQCVTDIRRALGDDGHGLIKTVPLRGYMFVGAAEEAEPAAAEGPTGGTGPAPDRRPVQPVGAPQALWQRGLIAAVLLVTALGGSGWLLWSLARPAELMMQARPSLVVLPVEPPGDSTDGALATLADEIATGIWRAVRPRPATDQRDQGSEA
jgi:DNA-binding winged helix-turn-helix (wHTH) protein